MDFPKVKIANKCKDCGEEFTISSSTGPSNICDPCTIPYLEAVWGPDWRTFCVPFN